eukprot:13493443-Alexandrium_andersonii.AAC.1
MSASLVGSEMCIRDSPEAPVFAQGPGERSEGPVGHARARDRWERAGAVSYTHLTLPTICSV